MDKQLGNINPVQRNTEEWQALLTYRNSLVQGEHEIHPITLKQAAQKRYGKRKQHAPQEGMLRRFHPFKPNAISHYKQLDQSISFLRVVGW